MKSCRSWKNHVRRIITVSTVLRVLQNKGFVAYRSFGKNYQYYPLVSKESYTNRFMNRVVDNFFSGSVKAMVSFFTKKEKMSVQEIDELIEMLKENKKRIRYDRF